MQAYKLVVPEGVQVGDVVWLSFDPKTHTVTCVPDHEVKERERDALDRLIPIVGNRAMGIKLGPHEELWPEVVRLAAQRDPPAVIKFANFDLNPEAYWTKDPVYDVLPKNIEASSKICYAACFTAMGQKDALDQFLQSMGRARWTRLGQLTALGLRVDLFWATDMKGPCEWSGKTWATWQESMYWKNGSQPYGVRSYCTTHQHPDFRISVRKNKEGRPIAVLVTEGRGAPSTLALTVHTKEVAGELPL